MSLRLLIATSRLSVADEGIASVHRGDAIIMMYVSMDKTNLHAVNSCQGLGHLSQNLIISGFTITQSYINF